MIDPELAGLTALVTGGASGIGRALVVGLQAEGVVVAVVDRSESDIGSVRIQETLGDERTSERVVASVEKALGRIDLLVNCAAVARHEPLAHLSTDAWEATLSSNLGSCVWTCRAVARRMISVRRGSILVVGSTSVSTPAPGESLYRASKAGLKAFAEVVALELAPHGIRVNLLTPGAVKTPLTAGMSDRQRARLVAEIPLAREAVPEELVATALMLLSDRLSPYTTGAEFVVDGGISLRPLALLDPEGIEPTR